MHQSVNKDFDNIKMHGTTVEKKHNRDVLHKKVDLQVSNTVYD